MIHARRHPTLDVDGCFACRIASVAVAASARGSIRAQSGNEIEARWSRDMDAYRRLKRDGVQPPRIDGCAEREATANTLKEVER